MGDANSMQRRSDVRKREVAGLAVAALWAACAAAPAEVQRPDGAGAGRGPLAGAEQDGPWQYFHANGQLASAGRFVRDVRDGPWQFWYPDGTPQQAGSYGEDRQVGAWRFWHPNGQLACQGDYRRGREHGEWSFFHDNGQLQQRGCFADGQRWLRWTSYDRDGRLLAAGPYFADRPCDRWTQGKDGAEAVVRYPLPAGVQYHSETWPDGSPRREGFLRDGAADGLWATRHPGGRLRAIGTMQGGRPEGDWQMFAADGSVLAAGAVRGDRLLGWSATAAGGALPADGTVIPPWNGTWSEAGPEAAARQAPLATVAQWLAEVRSPLPVEALPGEALPPTPPPGPPPSARLEAPTDPGEFTVRERAELETYRRYLRDGFLPRGSSLSAQYGGGRTEGLGAGDADRAQALLGKRLPVTRFPTGDGGELDVEGLRGRKVLLVVLRGFTSQVCVYCYAQTRELAPVTARLRELGCELVVLFPGTKSRFDAFVAACDREFGASPAPYRMAYDPDLTLAKALGLEGNLARPSTLLLDAEGVVRFAYVAESVQNAADRPAVQRLLDLVRRLDAPE